jgi:hypothetical protein
LEVLVLLYLAVGAVCALSALVWATFASAERMHRVRPEIQRNPSVDQDGIDLWDQMSRFQAAVEARPLGAARRWVSAPLPSLVVLTTWPAHVRAGVVVENVQSLAALQLSPAYFLQEAVCQLGFASLVLLARAVSGEGWPVRLGAYAVVVSMLAFLVFGLVNQVDIRGLLRQTTAPPVITGFAFALVAACNLAALTIAAYVLLDWPAGASFQWNAITSEGAKLLRLSHLGALWGARSEGVTVLLLGVTSLAVYAVLISRVVSVLLYRKEDRDKVAIALKLVQAGRPAEAERWLAKQQNSAEIDRTTEFARGLVAIANGDFSKAVGFGKSWRDPQVRDTNSPSDGNEANWALARMSRPLLETGQVDLYLQVLTYLVDNRISDPCLGAITSWTRTEQVPMIERFLAKYPDSSFPLTRTTSAVKASKWAEATRCLDRCHSRARGAVPMKQALSAYLAVQQHGDEPIVEVVRRSFAKLQASADKGWDSRELPLWLKQYLVDRLEEWRTPLRVLGEHGLERWSSELSHRLLDDKARKAIQL